MSEKNYGLEIDPGSYWFFGTGSVAVSVSHMSDDKAPCIILSDCEPHEIGSYSGGDDAVACINNSERNAVLVFRSIASLDVVLDALKIAREDLEAKGNTATICPPDGQN